MFALSSVDAKTGEDSLFAFQAAGASGGDGGKMIVLCSDETKLVCYGDTAPWLNEDPISDGGHQAAARSGFSAMGFTQGQSEAIAEAGFSTSTAETQEHFQN